MKVALSLSLTRFQLHRRRLARPSSRLPRQTPSTHQTAVPRAQLRQYAPPGFGRPHAKAPNGRGLKYLDLPKKELRRPSFPLTCSSAGRTLIASRLRATSKSVRWTREAQQSSLRSGDPRKQQQISVGRPWPSSFDLLPEGDHDSIHYRITNLRSRKPSLAHASAVRVARYICGRCHHVPTALWHSLFLRSVNVKTSHV